MRQEGNSEQGREWEHEAHGRSLFRAAPLYPEPDETVSARIGWLGCAKAAWPPKRLRRQSGLAAKAKRRRGQAAAFWTGQGRPGKSTRTESAGRSGG
jgi:hypothetical protein